MERFGQVGLVPVIHANEHVRPLHCEQSCGGRRTPDPALFSGEKIDNPRQIWLVDPAPKVIESLQNAMQTLGEFMESQGLSNTPEDVPNLKGDAARGQFITLFKEVQRLKTQLDQYTDLSEEQAEAISQTVPTMAPP